MKKTRVTYLLAISTVFFLFGTPEAVKACDCTGPAVDYALEAADAAFSGRISKIEFLDPHGEDQKKEPRIVVHFEVYRVWKGEVKRKTVLHTVYNYYSCAGYWFYEGKEYLVFAQNNDAKTARQYPKSKQSLGVGICNGTAELPKTEKDVIKLGRGKVPK